MTYPSIEARIMSNVDIQPGPGMVGCWEWQLSLDRTGYARAKFEKKMKLVHRVSYEHFIGLIPDGLHIDHLCHNRACVNPTHLEPTTNLVNVHRGHVRMLRAAQTHCINGHPFYGHNLRITEVGKRHCRTCGNARQRARNRGN